MQRDKYKLKKKPALLSPFINTFNFFIGRGEGGGLYLTTFNGTVLPFRHFAILCFN